MTDDQETSAERRQTARDVETDRVERAAQLARQDSRASQLVEQDRMTRATELAVEADRQRQRMDTAVSEVNTLKVEMTALRLEVAKATLEVGKLGMSMEFLNLRLFGGPSPNDNGEFGKLYEKISGQAATVIVRYLLGIIAVVAAGVILALLIHGR